MIGMHHFIVILCGMIGLFLSGVLIDLDHYNTSGTDSWKCKWYGFWGTHGEHPECDVMARSRLHNPIVMLSLSMFFIMLGVGFLIHFIMDYVHVPGFS
jgi:hypothetical protein